MTQISETVFSKNIVLKTKEIYQLSLDIIDNMDAFGAIIEKNHEFETDGPRKFVNIIFDMEEIIDDHASIIFSFLINGESNGTGFLDIKIDGSFFLDMPHRKTLGYLAFSSYYSEHLLSMLEKNMTKKIEKMGKFIEKKIEKLNLKYA
jgi:hypothetical protein